MLVFSVDHNQKKSRFDRLHGRKVSTFFPQMVMGGQQKDTRARTFGIGACLFHGNRFGYIYSNIAPRFCQEIVMRASVRFSRNEPLVIFLQRK